MAFLENSILQEVRWGWLIISLGMIRLRQQVAQFAQDVGRLDGRPSRSMQGCPQVDHPVQVNYVASKAAF
jgi:hypothetical protein